MDNHPTTTSTTTATNNNRVVEEDETPMAVVVLVPRHSGRVYVRGRIRRIWRPRYIELMEDGTLRYYEETTTTVVAGVPTTTTTNTSHRNNHNNHHNNSNHEYKYTLIVNGARILDVTTIRDLHTGLPRGTFGFVVRGQRQSPQPLLLLPQQQQQLPTSSIIPSNTTPTIATTSNHDAMTDSFVFAGDEDEYGGVRGIHGTNATSTGTTTTTTTTNNNHNVIVPTIRDYLCAVPTLEEAQMWVVALQWAASMSHTQPQPQPQGMMTTTTTTSTTLAPNRSLPPVVDHHWWNVDYTNTKSTSTIPSTATTTTTTTGIKDAVVTPKLKGNQKEGVNTTNTAVEPVIVHDSDTTAAVVLVEDSKIMISQKNNDDIMKQENNNNSHGKVLVTAVTGYSVVRYTTWTFEIVYHIHAMLLYNNNDSTTETNEPITQQQQQQQRYVEQWSLQRTAGQFQAVATELFHHRNTNTNDTEERNTNSNSDSHVLRRLPTWSRRPTIMEVDQSLSIVDSILRSWILSPHMVNTDVLKQFLGLEHLEDSKVNNNSTSTSGNDSIGSGLFQSLFRNVHNTNPFSIRNKSTTKVPNHISSDIYVREWLQSVRRSGIAQRATTTTSSNANTTTIGLLSLLFKNKPTTNTDISQIAIQLHHHHYHERNMLYFGGAAVAVIGMIPTVIPLWKYIMPVINIRFDYLLASWVGATYLGHRIGLASATSNSSKSTKTDRGGTSSNQRHKVPMSSRHNKLGTAGPSSSTSLKSITTNTIDQQQAQQTPDSPKVASSSDNSVVMVTDYVDAVHSSDMDDFADFVPTSTEHYYHQLQQNVTDDINDDDESDGEATTLVSDDLMHRPANNVDFLSSLSNDNNNGLNNDDYLSSPLPKYPNNNGSSCWSQPSHDIFHVRGATYLRDKIKVCSGPSPLVCRGVDVWITDNPERHIARHPSILGGKLNDVDTFLVNFLLPFGNLVAYFEIPPLSSFPSKLRTVWTKFLKGDQQYRDARLKLLPVVVDGPWIVKTAVGPGKSPALLGKAIPLQYFFRDPDGRNRKGVYEVDVIITASTIAKGILSVVKSQTKTVSIAFAFIIEAVDQSELPETVLCSFQVHSLHLEECPSLPPCNLD